MQKGFIFPRGVEVARLRYMKLEVLVRMEGVQGAVANIRAKQPSPKWRKHRQDSAPDARDSPSWLKI